MFWAGIKDNGNIYAQEFSQNCPNISGRFVPMPQEIAFMIYVPTFVIKINHI